MQIKQLTPVPQPRKKGLPLVELQQIEVSFGGQKALQNINLTVYANSITTIVGPNGGGKSTLLKVLLKLLAPTKGKVIHQKGLKIGYVPQKLHLDHSMPITVQKFYH
ncbi:high-affinity zinc uptake system ATP-binding protein ZnuC [Actinobacillus equuli]|nr:high-affinity zinc uptake system ATP-binding protein ZnuC [Actinobacillus equuli]